MSMRISGKSLSSILIILILFINIAPAAGQDIFSIPWEDGVVTVLLGSQYGTGWWISDNYLVTAAHVINYQLTKVQIIKGPYQAIGQVVAFDQKNDIAIIYVDDPPANQYIFELAKVEPTQGMKIYPVGYPFELYQIYNNVVEMSSRPRIAMGIVAWVDEEKGIFELSATVDAGNSGGPVLDSNGNVVGLVSFALKGPAGTMYYATSLNRIKSFLEQQNISYKLDLVGAAKYDLPQPLYSNIFYTALGAGVSAIVTIIILSIVRGRRRAA